MYNLNATPSYKTLYVTVLLLFAYIYIYFAQFKIPYKMDILWFI